MREFIDYLQRLEADNDILPWSGYLPNKSLSKVLGVDFYDLPTAVRALLIADGTVTMMLEALFKEPIKVATVSQQPLAPDLSFDVFPAEQNEELLFREVELLGQHSQQHYVRAYSMLKRSAIDDSLWQGLLEGKVGIGVVLRHASKANYRKVVHMGMGGINSEDQTKVHRSYCVYLEDKPAILITEVFDLAMFEGVG